MCSSIARPLLSQIGVGWRGRKTCLDSAAHLRVEELLPAVLSFPTEVWKPISLQCFLCVCFEVSESSVWEFLRRKPSCKYFLDERSCCTWMSESFRSHLTYQSSSNCLRFWDVMVLTGETQLLVMGCSARCVIPRVKLAWKPWVLER